MSQILGAGGGGSIAVPLPVNQGGTGLVTITDHAVMVGSGTSPVTPVGPGTDGQLLIGSTGADPVWAALTSSGATITISGGAGTLNIETAGTIAASFPTDAGTATPAAGALTIAGGNDISTSGAGSTVTVAISGTTQYGVQVGDATGGIASLAVGATNQVLLGNTGGNPSWGAVDLTTDVTGILPVANGGTGLSTITDHGVMVGSGAGAVTPLAVGTNGQVIVGSTGADPVFATISSTDGTIDITGGAGTLDLDLSADVQVTGIHGWNGAILESPAVTVTSDGVTITFSVERSGGGDLTVVFSDGFYDWDTTPADTVSLTAGSDTSPQINYVYFLQSTKTLTASAVSWPATEHAPLATVLCQSAASLQTDGAYKVHAWTDHVVNTTDDMGHIAHLNEWIRNQNATWISGVAPTLTITPNGGAADNVIFTCGSGTVLQLHDHTFPAFAGTPDVYTVNDSVTPYNVVTDLNALLTDSAGVSMSGRYFSLVVWGVVSEASADCKLMVNLPAGSYGTQAQLEADAEGYANYTIPSDFKGTGFLIYQMDLRHQVAASGTWTSIQNLDLRGLFPSLSAGGSTSFATEFEDNVFRILDNGDVTKELAFECSTISAATTRTITMCDQDLSLVSPQFPGSVTAATGLTVTANDATISAGNLNLPTTNAALTEGVIEINSVRQFHAYGTDNIFIGPDAGNGTLSGSYNTGIGPDVLQSLTSGNYNMGLGNNALKSVQDGSLNVAMGAAALTKVTSGSNNTSVGQSSTFYCTTGIKNTAIGSDALQNVVSGGYNLALGNNAGFNLTTSDSDNIYLMNSGTAGDNNEIHIGTQGTGNGQQNKCFIAGIYNTTPAGGNDGNVIIDSNGQLGTIAAYPLVWNEVTGTSQSASVNNGYIANNAALVTITLPATATVGSVVRIIGLGAGGWKLAQNASQYIRWDESTVTTTGVGGSLDSTDDHDAVELLCTVTNNGWSVLSSKGNISVT